MRGTGTDRRAGGANARVSDALYAWLMISRPTRVAIGAALSLALAACGGGAPAVPSSSPATAASAAAVLPVPVSSEFRVGKNRTIFSLLDPTGQKPVAAPNRTLSIAYRGPNGETIAPTPQTFTWAIEGVNGVYIGEATFPSAGAWTAELATEAPGSPTATQRFSFDVREQTTVIAPGDPAPSVDTPTLEDVGGDLTRISTDTKPVRRFYETSVAEALAAKEPFVLVFSTPKFCRFATCGPTLDKVKTVALAHPDLTFINIEPYRLELTDGQLQPVLTEGQLTPAAATIAYRLLSEPYVFIVGADGKVASSFELVFAPEEIEAAIAAVE